MQKKEILLMEDIHELVDTFYAQIRSDELLVPRPVNDVQFGEAYFAQLGMRAKCGTL